MTLYLVAVEEGEAEVIEMAASVAFVGALMDHEEEEVEVADDLVEMETVAAYVEEH